MLISKLTIVDWDTNRWMACGSCLWSVALQVTSQLTSLKLNFNSCKHNVTQIMLKYFKVNHRPCNRTAYFWFTHSLGLLCSVFWLAFLEKQFSFLDRLFGFSHKKKYWDALLWCIGYCIYSYKIQTVWILITTSIKCLQLGILLGTLEVLFDLSLMVIQWLSYSGFQEINVRF